MRYRAFDFLFGKTGLHKFIGIEFARGVAAFMVLLSHYSGLLTEERTILNFLWTGVDLFFVISGFVFARLIFASQINICSFLIRRFFRIYPLYFIALLAYFFLSGSHAEKVNYFVHHLFFLNTITSREEAFFFNPAFWSLPVEIEFYLLIPLLVFIGSYKKSIFVIFVFFLGFKLFLVSNSSYPDNINVYDKLNFHLTGILPEFMIGLYLYQFVIFSRKLNKNTIIKLNFISTFFGFLIITILALYFVKHGDDGLKANILISGWFNLLCAIGYALILFPLSSIEKWSSSKIINNTFTLVGSISYPVYLIHNASPLLFQAIKSNISGLSLFIACTVLTICISIILHKYIEEPLRIYGRSLSKSLS